MGKLAAVSVIALALVMGTGMSHAQNPLDQKLRSLEYKCNNGSQLADLEQEAWQLILA
jgi:hypothetical protein